MTAGTQPAVRAAWAEARRGDGAFAEGESHESEGCTDLLVRRST